MKPMAILALIAGGATGVTTNMLLGGGLRAPGGARQHLRGARRETAAGRVTFVVYPLGAPRRGGDVPHRGDHPAGLAQARPRGVAATDDASARRSRRPRRRRARSAALARSALGGQRSAAEREAEAAYARRDGDRTAARSRRHRHHEAGQEHRVRLRRGHGLVGDGCERSAQQDQEGGHRGRHGRQQGDRRTSTARPIWSSRRTSSRIGLGRRRRTRSTSRSTTS